MKPFPKCPVCGGEMKAQTKEKLLRGGRNTAVMTAPAEVCLRCGETLYAVKVVRRFEEVRSKLAAEDTGEFEPLGKAFSAPMDRL